jgi:hypothetical protein
MRHDIEEEPVAIREKIASNARRFLEPGEQIQAVLPAQTASQWLALLGFIFFLISNRYRCVVATDRRILVLDAGKWTMGNPRSIVRVLARSTIIGPAYGTVWYPCNTLGELLRIHRRYFNDIAQADAMAWRPPQAGTAFPPPPPPPPPGYPG